MFGIGFWCFLAAGVALQFAHDRLVRVAGLLLIVGTLAQSGLLLIALFVGLVLLTVICLSAVVAAALGSSKPPIVAADRSPPEEDLTSSESIQCLQCGAQIPTGAAICSQCGWTYRIG
jgi:hypothetical protein